MNLADSLRNALVTVAVNETFSEAVLGFRDQSQLCFCHRVGERWAKAIPPDIGLATDLLAAISTFRLNAKHLDIQFSDGSRWDERLQQFAPGNP
jgi:hypothetical protein